MPEAVVEKAAQARVATAFVPEEKPTKATASADEVLEVEVPDIPYEEMSVEQLQAAILAKMAKNGPVTPRMRKDVTDNIWPDSLRNWVKSF